MSSEYIEGGVSSIDVKERSWLDWGESIREGPKSVTETEGGRRWESENQVDAREGSVSVGIANGPGRGLAVAPYCMVNP